MRFIKETTLTIFSIMILLISVIISLVIFCWIDMQAFIEIEQKIILGESTSTVILILNAFFILLSLICIFFDSTSKDELKDGVLLQNESGKLLISRETLENLINDAVKGFDSLQIVSSKTSLDKEGKVIVYLTMCVSGDVVIKDLSTNLQVKIKEAVKNLLI